MIISNNIKTQTRQRLTTKPGLDNSQVAISPLHRPGTTAENAHFDKGPRLAPAVRAPRSGPLQRVPARACPAHLLTNSRGTRLKTPPLLLHTTRLHSPPANAFSVVTGGILTTCRYLASVPLAALVRLVSLFALQPSWMFADL